jgi:membrane protease subunit (stomatin/prohibitin family)
MKMETVEHFAQIALVTHVLGQQQLIDSADLEKLVQARSKYVGVNSAAAMPVCSSNGNGAASKSSDATRRKHRTTSDLRHSERARQLEN